ncbi:MAG TPA: SGNH/GDSL hydrolase family protein [Terriglobales bacterium]|nr:SGNH/GDSL hydrolase family protein [Terriglobales bacterium]
MSKKILTASLFVFFTFTSLGNAAKTKTHWVGTWATSDQQGDASGAPPAPAFTDSTLRQIVHVSIGGKQIRVRFSNAYGTTGLTIPAAHIALSAGRSAIKSGSDKALSFHGSPSVTIPPGALIYSDPINFDLVPLSDLVVTIRLNGAPEVFTTHPASHATSYVHTGDVVSSDDMATWVYVDHWYFLDGVDVLADKSAGAIVTFGDSITDGSKSTTNANARWPDELARRLQANKKTQKVSILNQGIGGNRLIHDRAAQNALARFDRDVLGQNGVRWLIVLEGVNDLGTRTSAKEHNEQAATPDDLIAAYEQIIYRAHAHNIRVYGATILPYEGARYYTPDGEADRQKVNQWIRTSGHFDAVIDLDAVTRDSKNPAHLSEAADSGDHLHPADGGYKIMGGTVDLKLFEK